MLPSFELADQYNMPSQAIVHMAGYIVGGSVDILYLAHAEEELQLFNTLNPGREATLAELRAAAEELIALAS